jgi:hypothetical protein
MAGDCRQQPANRAEIGAQTLKPAIFSMPPAPDQRSG